MKHVYENKNMHNLWTLLTVNTHALRMKCAGKQIVMLTYHSNVMDFLLSLLLLSNAFLDII